MSLAIGVMVLSDDFSFEGVFGTLVFGCVGCYGRAKEESNDLKNKG